MKSRHKTIAGKQRHLTGWHRDRPDHRDQFFPTSILDRFGMPNSFSLRGAPGLVVEDQANLGSCTCNAGTTGHEFILQKHGVTIQLSRLWAYARVREFEGCPLTEDNGAQIRDVVKVLAKYGCPPEALWPYDVTKWSQRPPTSTDIEAAKHKLTYYYRCSTLGAIRLSISQGYPVVGGFEVPENMMSTFCQKTGIVKLPAPEEGYVGGHAVLFMGYNDERQMLEFQNSWSTGWGDGGYGWLPYEFVKRGLADDFWTVRRST
jgi:C1A family cysteine protease